MGSHTLIAPVSSRGRTNQSTLNMNTFGLAICLALLVGVAVSQDCCADSCGKACEVSSLLCINIPMINQCDKLKGACNQMCAGMCKCEADCIGKCIATAKTCKAGAKGPLAGPLCQATEARCVAMCNGQCGAKTMMGAAKAAVGQMMALMPKMPAAPAPIR